jgi:ribosomal protein S18 acetylase RimI-like enzyme
MEVSFQPILTQDVSQLREIAVKTFIQSYQHLNSISNFEWYIEKAFNRERLIEELKSDKSFFYFVKDKKNYIGYLKLNIDNSQTEEHSEIYLEIERIYLDDNYQRRGIGNKMIHFAVKKAKQHSKLKIWLGVWEKNPKAISFYKSLGFVNTGSHIFKFGDEDQLDIIFEKSVEG